ncbi:DUF4350 domain-containing protein [Pseudomonas oryzihabitans]|uniref:DUF4350 domain-containing protein n=1 Tax=Pseudomonas oryzihabitans TaxID=47885 RepID=UPI00289474BA|nr:DUF4350 domain-containing protein [Pseudomonas oryzihabitans]MDT3722008.1 DUF4350 domain-containing protein [Pseudomonas oryzihabitans]
MRSVDRLFPRAWCRLAGQRLGAWLLALMLPLTCLAQSEPLSCPLPPQADSGPASLRLTHQGLDSQAARQIAAQLSATTSRNPESQALAAAFLQHFGGPVTRFSAERLDELPAQGMRLWLAGNPQLQEQQAQDLLDWVAAGGHLVAVADDSTLALSATLGVRPMPTRELGGAVQPIMALPLWPNLTQLYLAEDDAPAYLGFDDSRHLFDVGDQATAWASSASATHMLLLPWGEGSVTLLSDTELWSNARLGQYDNAWLLWYLTQGAPVALIAPAPPAPLWQEALQRFGLALALLLATLIAWRWRRRLEGVAQPARPPEPWPDLIATLQRDIQRQLQRRRPELADQGVAERWQYLARLSGLPTRAVGEAMRPCPARPGSREITLRVMQLRQLRLALRSQPPRTPNDR